jgi:hypothetical protein
MNIPTTAQAATIIADASGGTVTNIERQLRWRPTWFAEVQVGMVLRGDRTDSEAFPLRHEYTFHQLMEEQGLPVPHLYGFIETPGFLDAVLMARVPGKPDFDGVSDVDRDYARYEQFTGRPIDLEAIKRHHFAACMGNGLQFGAAWRDPLPDTDVMNIMQWSSETNLMATDFLGEYLGLDLPRLDPPPSLATRHDTVSQQLVRSLGSVKVDDREAQHEMRLAFRMARHLQRRSEIGAALDAADIADVAAMIGRRPLDWHAAERELEQFVLDDAAVGRYDEPLTVLFHKRNQRLHMALGPAGSSMVRHYECQRFDGGPSRIVQF